MQPKLPKVNILLVDDNASNLLALETVLAGDDRNLVTAASGEQALQYLLHNEVAVILLDVRMPGITGLETAELIRGRKRTRDLPIIFLTAYDSGDESDLTKGYSLGAVDYIIKPFNPEALKSKVAVFVDLYKKTEQIKQQAALLHEKNIQLENANFQRLGKLVELGQRLSAEREPQPLLQLFCDATCDILGARWARVVILDPPGKEPRECAQCGFDSDAEVDLNVLSKISTSASSVRISKRGGRSAILKHRDIDSLLAVRIPLPTGTLGWLYLMNKLDAEELSEADERLALTLSSQLAVAYESARLYGELRQEVIDRKRAQEEKEQLLLREKAARLEAEQAQQLSSDLLIREKEARTEAEAANRLKDEFLATVSHELRTPLNSILGWAQLMRTGTLDEESATRALQTIERNTKALAQIIEDLLDVSRIITGKLRLDVKPIELGPVVDAALDAVRPATNAKNIRLHISLDPMVGIVYGDPHRLQQVVWNLLSNAIKFTPTGGEVRVELDRIDSSARITVRDSGEGISESFLPH